MAVPMANDPPFAMLNHSESDSGIPNESAEVRFGMTLPRGSCNWKGRYHTRTYCAAGFQTGRCRLGGHERISSEGAYRVRFIIKSRCRADIRRPPLGARSIHWPFSAWAIGAF